MVNVALLVSSNLISFFLALSSKTLTSLAIYSIPFWLAFTITGAKYPFSVANPTPIFTFLYYLMKSSYQEELVSGTLEQATAAAFTIRSNTETLFLDIALTWPLNLIKLSIEHCTVT